MSEKQDRAERGGPDTDTAKFDAPGSSQTSTTKRRARSKTTIKSSSGTKPIEEKIFGKELKNVPTTLEQAMAMEKESQTSNEVLGVLVDAHIKEAHAILGRTFLRREDVGAVTDCLELARKGIGGVFRKPMPWLSEWVLDKLRALPSIEGKSREQFVNAWGNSRDERRRQDEQKNREKSQGFA
jgi:hypothetical protein